MAQIITVAPQQVMTAGGGVQIVGQPAQIVQMVPAQQPQVVMVQQPGQVIGAPGAAAAKPQQVMSVFGNGSELTLRKKKPGCCDEGGCCYCCNPCCWVTCLTCKKIAPPFGFKGKSEGLPTNELYIERSAPNNCLECLCCKEFEISVYGGSDRQEERVHRFVEESPGCCEAVCRCKGASLAVYNKDSERIGYAHRPCINPCTNPCAACKETYCCMLGVNLRSATDEDLGRIEGTALQLGMCLPCCTAAKFDILDKDGSAVGVMRRKLQTFCPSDMYNIEVEFPSNANDIKDYKSTIMAGVTAFTYRWFH